MANISLRVVFADGTDQTVKTRPASEVAYERKFDRSISDGLTRNEHVYFLAWHAARTTDEFDAWLDRVEEIDVLGSDTPDPSEAAATTT